MIRQIKYFHAVIRCGSFAEAAEECCISESAISQQIKALEKNLGVHLLKRQNRSFIMTPAGEYFYEKTQKLLTDFDRICTETSRIDHDNRAVIKIGYLKCYGGLEFQQALAAFSEKYPKVNVQISYGNHEELYDGLRNGMIDLALNDLRRNPSDLYVNFHLIDSACQIELSSRNPLAEKKHLEIRDLQDLTCILVASPDQKREEENFYRKDLGFDGSVRFADTIENARMLLLSGNAFLPMEGGGEPVQYGGAIRRIPLFRNKKQVTRSYYAFWKADNSGYYIEEFADILKSFFK